MMLTSTVCVRSFYRSSQVKFPSIKFRYGTKRSEQPAVAASSSSAGQAAVSSSNEAIQDYQLPLKYRRKFLDEDEIAYINRGGPE